MINAGGEKKKRKLRMLASKSKLLPVTDEADLARTPRLSTMSAVPGDLSDQQYRAAIDANSAIYESPTARLQNWHL
jgi:hypothetical protein